MPKILSVDTSKSNRIHVQLIMGQKKLNEESYQQYGSQVLLNLITKLLKKTKLDLKDLDEIKVETGPGSFTGIRVGVSVANALGFALNIPVNGKKMETALKY